MFMDVNIGFRQHFKEASVARTLHFFKGAIAFSLLHKEIGIIFIDGIVRCTKLRTVRFVASQATDLALESCDRPSIFFGSWFRFPLRAENLRQIGNVLCIDPEATLTLLI